MIQCQRCKRDELDTPVSSMEFDGPAIRVVLCHDCHNDLIEAFYSSGIEAKAIAIQADGANLVCRMKSGDVPSLADNLRYFTNKSEFEFEAFRFIRDFTNAKPE